MLSKFLKNIQVAFSGLYTLNPPCTTIEEIPFVQQIRTDVEMDEPGFHPLNGYTASILWKAHYYVPKGTDIEHVKEIAIRGVRREMYSGIKEEIKELRSLVAYGDRSSAFRILNKIIDEINGGINGWHS